MRRSVNATLNRKAGPTSSLFIKMSVSSIYGLTMLICKLDTLFLRLCCILINIVNPYILLCLRYSEGLSLQGRLKNSRVLTLPPVTELANVFDAVSEPHADGLWILTLAFLILTLINWSRSGKVKRRINISYTWAVLGLFSFIWGLCTFTTNICEK